VGGTSGNTNILKCSISGKFFRHNHKQTDEEEPKLSVCLHRLELTS